MGTAFTALKFERLKITTALSCFNIVQRKRCLLGATYSLPVLSGARLRQRPVAYFETQ